MPRLTRSSLTEAVGYLCARDEDLAAIVERHGPPAFWSRPPGFATLVYIILEQQVSLASARATWLRIGELLEEFSPASYLSLSDAQLRAAGVSRQKARYTRLLAEAVVDGTLPLARLARMRDEGVRSALTSITGIGNWTADVYMMSALRRPDRWPIGDLALVKAIMAVKGLDERPSSAWLDALGESYRPFRSVAARIYWHHYLDGGSVL